MEPNASEGPKRPLSPPLQPTGTPKTGVTVVAEMRAASEPLASAAAAARLGPGGRGSAGFEVVGFTDEREEERSAVLDSDGERDSGPEQASATNNASQRVAR